MNVKNSEKEVWKGMIYGGVDYSAWMLVSNKGRFKNPKTGTIRSKNLLKTGYLFISFSMGSRSLKKTIRCHKAIAETFIPNPNGYPIINHIDGKKTNNEISNLEWCTYSHNSIHALKMGLTVPSTGEDAPGSKLKKSDVDFIRKIHIPRSRKFGSRAIARNFNVAHTTVSRIISGKTWGKD